ncbi:hypothetical protein BBJ28_00025991 [Nothophytophthora sp. Chile5]|nr:hypothetical protein BBJ28_00025991 [Nothophytophthora sp. Chile5]
MMSVGVQRRHINNLLPLQIFWWGTELKAIQPIIRLVSFANLLGSKKTKNAAMQPRLASVVAAAALVAAAAPQAKAAAVNYTLGSFTVTVDANVSSLDVVNSAGDQVWT